MWYIDNGNYGKRGFTKQVVDATLRKHDCGFDVRNAGNIRKGIKNFYIGNKIFVPLIFIGFAYIVYIKFLPINKLQ